MSRQNCAPRTRAARVISAAALAASIVLGVSLNTGVTRPAENAQGAENEPIIAEASLFDDLFEIIENWFGRRPNRPADDAPVKPSTGW